MPIDPRHTQIKETAYALAQKFGWLLEYNGGLELDGEFVDDADLSLERSEDGLTVEYVLNISYADTTAYGFTLTRENSGAGSSFDSSTAGPTPGASFGAGAFATEGLPGQNAVTLAEKYYITTITELREAVEVKLTALGL